MFGAALATSISYFMCFLLFCGFCVQKRIKTESKTFYITPTHNKRDYRTEFCDFFKTRRSEYFSNHTQSYFVPYGRTFHRRLRIISRMLMFALFPILGITQGFIPIAGYNHGAQNYERVKKYPNFYQICSC
jgi:Na+-driven multidrug efflux pump